MKSPLAKYFLLDSSITFLNHGSFGACPIPILEKQQEWQREVERQPVEFFQRRAPAFLTGARAALAAFLNVTHQDLVFVTNATTGMNIVTHSLNLKAGDEVLATNHEYGAVDRAWRFNAKERGFTYKIQPIPLAHESSKFCDLLWQGVTKNTRVISISHITSPTATIFPVIEVCKRARAEGIITVIDGAHAPGQIDLDLSLISPDFYTGNLHKWLCAPKGSAFLYVRPEMRRLIKPFVVSWGYEAEEPTNNQFLDYTEFMGTRDLSQFLVTPSAIEFQSDHDWPKVRKHCHMLLSQIESDIRKITRLPSIYSSDTQYSQMAAVALPKDTDVVRLKEELINKFRIEVPVYKWHENPLLRVSVQAYNTHHDLDRLRDALIKLLK